jgi:hypothetical protein
VDLTKVVYVVTFATEQTIKASVLASSRLEAIQVASEQMPIGYSFKHVKKLTNIKEDN